MEVQAYRDMVNDQDEHWWYKARRELLSEEIKRLDLCEDAKILEIGCGPGGNLSMLADYGEVYAIELDDYAREQARMKSQVDVLPGSLPHNIPFKANSFDLVCLFDVLEHVEQDKESLEAIKEYLLPGGKLIMTIPAYQWLYSTHDKILHHHRRYSRKGITKLLDNCNYQIIRMSFYNTILFPVLLIARLIDLFTDNNKSTGSDTPAPWLNRILYNLFRFEKYILRYVKLPYGATMLFVLEN
jgi:SAM-dependent methyltransferase